MRRGSTSAPPHRALTCDREHQCTPEPGVDIRIIDEMRPGSSLGRMELRAHMGGVRSGCAEGGMFGSGLVAGTGDTASDGS